MPFLDQVSYHQIWIQMISFGLYDYDFIKFFVISTCGCIINLLIMGNYCDFENKQADLPDVNPNIKFIHESWLALKKHQQLDFISQQDEKQVVSQLQCIPHKRNQTKILPVSVKPDRFIVIKQDSYFYVGTLLAGHLHGNGAVVLPNGKIFIGKFKYNRIEGKGQLHFPKGAVNNRKTMSIQGEWGSQVHGVIKIGEDDPEFPFSVNKAMVLSKKNCRYIQYPNYDEYIGETEDGLAHGTGKYIYRNGHKQNQYPIYQGNFIKGKRHGSGVMRLDSTMSLHIKWSEGRPDGIGFTQINDCKISVMYRGGKRIERLLSDVQ